MAATKEDRDKQAPVGVQVVEHRVTIAEGRIANLEEDEPTPVSPQTPGKTPLVEGDIQVPMAWQIRVVQVPSQGSKPVGARFEIYSPEAYNNGKKLTSMDWGTGGWTTLHEEKIEADMNVVARFTYEVKGEGEEKTRVLDWYATVVEASNKTPETPSDGVEVEDVLIATLHASGWQRITQYHTGAIFLGGGSGGGGAEVNPEDFNIYITRIGEEVWLTQGQKTTTTTSGTTYEPIRKVLRLDDLLYKAVISNFTDPNCSKEFCAVAALPMCFGSLGRVDKQGQVNVDVYGATWKPAAADILLRGYETSWMKSLCASYPESDTDQGFLEGMSSSGLFFSNEEPKDGGSEVYFYTELLDTNAARTYEST